MYTSIINALDIAIDLILSNYNDTMLDPAALVEYRQFVQSLEDDYQADNIKED